MMYLYLAFSRLKILHAKILDSFVEGRGKIISFSYSLVLKHSLASAKHMAVEALMHGNPIYKLLLFVIL